MVRVQCKQEFSGVSLVLQVVYNQGSSMLKFFLIEKMKQSIHLFNK